MSVRKSTPARDKNKEVFVGTPPKPIKLAEIAPGSYRDAAVDIFKEAVRETTDWKDKLIQFGAWALVVIFSLIAIIVITQMVKAGQAQAADLLLQAGTEGAQACKEICKEAVNIAYNTVAP